MNQEIANDLCPIYKAEIFEYFEGNVGSISNKNIIKVKLNVYRKNNFNSDWILFYEDDLDQILTACAHLSTVYLRSKNNQEYIYLGDKNTKGKEVGLGFPLRTILIEEYLYGKDNGNSWDDPENDIRKKVKVEYFLKKGLNGDLFLDYTERGNFFEFNVMQAYITHIKLFECIPFEFTYPYWNVKNDEKISMFQAQGHMFKFTYHCYDQKSICGEAITNYIDDYEGDNTIKVNYLHDFVLLYKKDEIAAFMKKMFMNGKLLITFHELESLGISSFDIEFGKPNFINWVKMNYPEAKSVNSFMSWYTIK